MKKTVDSFFQELAGLRTGRATPALLDPIIVDAYGANTPLKQIAAISTHDARTLSVSVWDTNLVSSVEKAIIQSDLGLTPKTAGNVIHLPLPNLSGERRKEYAKLAGKYAEQARIAIRNIRRDGIDALRKQEKNTEISKDDLHKHSGLLQKMTDEHTAYIDESLAKKETEILGT